MHRKTQSNIVINPRRASARSILKTPLGVGAAACLLMVSLASGGCYNDPETRLAEIRAIQAGGKFDASIKPLRVLLTAEPDHPEANYRLGVALAQTARASLALWPLMKAANSDEFGVQAGLLLTATLISQESYEEAIRSINRVIEREPDNLSALYARASAFIGGARPADALTDAEHVLKIKPGDGQGHAIKMAALLDLKRYEEAEASQIELVGITESGTSVDQAARACGVLARFYADQNDNEKSLATHEVCLEKYPDHPMVRAWASEFFTITGDVDRAINLWRAAVDSNPEDFELRTTLANLLSSSDRVEEAEEIMQATAELFDTARAYQQLSRIYMLNDKPTQAREALETALSRTKNEPDSLRFTVGDLFIEEGDLDSAEEVANSLKEPSYRHLLKGAILLARNLPEEALKQFDAGLRLWPNNGRARYLAGVAAQRSGDHDRATIEFRESVRVSETETDASLQLARIYYTMGQYSTARQFAARHVANRPFDSPEAHIIDARSAVGLGQMPAAFMILDGLQKTIFAATAVAERASMLNKQHGPGPAIETIEKANLDLTLLSNTPAVRAYVDYLITADRKNDAVTAADALLKNNVDNVEAMEIKGRVLALVGRTSEAEAIIDKAIELQPEFAAALHMKGKLVAAAGDLDRAVTYFDKAAAADFNNPNYAYDAANLLKGQGKIDEAIERLRVLVAAEPGHIAANNDLAWYLAETGGDLDIALAAANRAASRDPNADTLDTLGWVQYKRGSMDRAIEFLSKALEMRPESASTRYRLGLSHSKAGSNEEAKAAFEQAIASGSFPELNEAKEALALLQGS